MPSVKRITDLIDYKSVLPYASEIFGVYQPLIGWKSTRKINRIKDAVRSEKNPLLSRLGRNLASTATINFNHDCFMTAPEPAGIAGPSHDSIVLQRIQSDLKNNGGVPADARDWERFINEDILTKILRAAVLDHYNQISIENCRRSKAEAQGLIAR